MKLITLNTHSLAEPDYERKTGDFVLAVKREKPDIIALQEVNQTVSQPAAVMPEDFGYVSSRGSKVLIRKDNHGLTVSRLLREAGCPYFWTWVPAKIGYGIYEEGLAVFSRSPIEKTNQFFISKNHDFHNWKTRKMVGIKAEGMWFYSVHMGWWEDEEEPFAGQWDRAVKEIAACTSCDETVWVMGDFNSPAGVLGEGWEYVRASGWKDTYELAGRKDGGITVSGMIDGWKERKSGISGKEKEAGMRIDYIWCNKKEEIDSWQVICNGINYPVVSDHYGIMITKKGR